MSISTLDSVTSSQQTAGTPGGAFAQARSNVMSAVASELGVSSSDLQSQLQSGKSLSQLASAAGISSDDLNATITGALQKSGLPASTDISAMATRMANHVSGQHHHHHAQASSSTDSSSTDTDSLVLALTSSTSDSPSVDTYL